MDEVTKNYVKGVIEALLFISEKPVSVEQIKEVIEIVSIGEIREQIKALQAEYLDRGSGINVVEIAGGYQMLSSSQYAANIRDFLKSKHKEKLSKPALETLAIIAYKQPVSRTDIEMIRGVNCDGVVVHLFNKGLIKIVGRKDVPGRPYIYGTTKQFLEHFGLKSLSDLPKLEDFSVLQESDYDAPEEMSEVPSAEDIQDKKQSDFIQAPNDENQEEVLLQQEEKIQEPDLQKAIDEIDKEASPVCEESIGQSRQEEMTESKTCLSDKTDGVMVRQEEQENVSLKDLGENFGEDSCRIIQED